MCIALEASVEAVEGMAVLRNLAAHDRNQVSEERALDYLTMTDAVPFALQGGNQVAQNDQSAHQSR